MIVRADKPEWWRESAIEIIEMRRIYINRFLLGADNEELNARLHEIGSAMVALHARTLLSDFRGIDERRVSLVYVGLPDVVSTARFDVVPGNEYTKMLMVLSQHKN